MGADDGSTDASDARDRADVDDTRDRTDATDTRDRTDPNDTRDRGDAHGTRRDVVDTGARWREAQERFVDAPREAVAAADDLVSDVVASIARRLDRDREEVAGLWDDDSDTETLRSVMLRYREVLDRLERQLS